MAWNVFSRPANWSQDFNMARIDPSDYPRLAEAIPIWTGWGHRGMPRGDDSLVVGHFGVEVASKLLPVIKSLAEEFASSNAPLLTNDLAEMGKIAGTDFKSKHPEMPEQIVQALAWYYTFNMR